MCTRNVTSLGIYNRILILTVCILTLLQLPISLYESIIDLVEGEVSLLFLSNPKFNCPCDRSFTFKRNWPHILNLHLGRQM